MKQWISVIAAAILAVQLCYADDPEHMEMAEQYIKVKQLERSYNTSIQDQFSGSIKQLMSVMPQQHQSQLEKVVPAIQDLFLQETAWQKVRNDVAALYVSRFSKAELKSLVSLMQSPAIQSMLEKQILVEQEMRQIMIKEMTALQMESLSILQKAKK